MSLLVDGTIDASVILACALAAAWLLRRQSAATRHWLFAAAIACAMAAPALTPIAPPWRVEIGAATVPPITHTDSVAAHTATSQASDSQPAAAPQVVRTGVGWWLASIWIAGSVCSLLLLLIGLARLARLASVADKLTDDRWLAAAADAARRTGVRRSIMLLSSERENLFTWGFARPKVVLPRSAQHWSDDRVRVVLLHEFAHIKRGDWVIQLVAEILRAVYWFNPLAWIASRCLRQESEQACDDVVLRDGVDGYAYAEHLLDLARSIVTERRPLVSGFPAAAMARPSSLERRFTAMLNDHVNRAPLSGRGRAATIAAVLLLTMLVAGFGAAQTFVSFSGSAFDPTNRVLPGVTVHLTNTVTQAKYEVRSDRTGRFEFVGLPPGDYVWEAQLPGFATLKGDVSVSATNIQRDLALQVGSIEETLTVRGGDSSGSSSAPASAAVQAALAERQLDAAKVCTPPTNTVGGQIRAPRALSHARPQYPDYLHASGVEGVVVLNALIGTDGDVRDVTVASAPDPGLGTAAADAVRQWQFSITRLNCEAIEVNMRVTVRFSL